MSIFSVIERNAAPACADPLHNVQHVLQRTRQTVELPDDDGIAFPQVVEQAMQFGPIPATAGGGFLEQALQPAALSAFVCKELFWSSPFGYPGIAEQSAASRPIRCLS